MRKPPYDTFVSKSNTFVVLLGAAREDKLTKDCLGYTYNDSASASYFDKDIKPLQPQVTGDLEEDPSVSDNSVAIDLRGGNHTLALAAEPADQFRNDERVAIGALACFLGLPSSPLHLTGKAAAGLAPHNGHPPNNTQRTRSPISPGRPDAGVGVADRWHLK